LPTERADVLVIGSGPSGAAVTKRLTDLGARVVCLEQGDWVNPADYPSTRPDYETSMHRGRFHLSPNVRRRPEDYPVVELGKHPPSVQMFNAVGGSTIHYSAHFPRFHPSDFRVKTLDGVAEDWPLDYQELESYYEMNDREMGVAGLSGDPANPPRPPRPTPPLPLGLMGEALGRGFDKLGWHWWVAENGIISRPYDGRPACDLHGKCSYGCPIGAKSSPEVTYWPKALKKGATLRTWARVCQVTVNEQGLARGAVYYDRPGALHEVTARVVVVCCNGVGTPRLLLNSRSKLFPAGLANSTGLVGKNFMMHAWRQVVGVADGRVDSHVGPRGVAVACQQFYETDLQRGFVRGYSFQAAPTLGPLSYAWAGYASRALPWGPDHHRVFRKRFPHLLTIWVQGEDLPVETNRVELDPEVKDSHGIPAPRVTYTHCENTLRMMEHGAAMARQVLEAAGAEEILDGGLRQPAWHLLGTARMGSDPKRSVVNAWHQSHDVKNLFIVDGSSFATSAAVNPTSTIGALALRCADGIWARRREWK